MAEKIEHSSGCLKMIKTPNNDSFWRLDVFE